MDGCGTVFKLDTNGNEIVLYSFNGGEDGANPDAGLVQDAQGNLYGTTAGGGSFGDGTVFMVGTNNKETVLYSFRGGTDGSNPHAGLVRDAQGNLYGTTPIGGAFDEGTVFEVDAKGQEIILHNFSGIDGDGAAPDDGLVQDAQGNLYGTTPNGGTTGLGTVFKVDTNGNETVLYSFSGAEGYPISGLVLDVHGNLYGTTYVGGNLACQDGCGTAFKVSENGKKTTLYSFTGGPDGQQPSSLVTDELGNLYGTTYEGGDLTCNIGLPGCGVVFKLEVLTPTTTVLSPSLNPSTYGQAVTFNSVVASKVGAPPDGELVSIMKGKTVLGTGTLSDGSASFTTSSLPVGTNSVTAVYVGDPNLASSTSKPVKQVVDKATTTSVLSSSPNPSNVGQSVTFVARVAPEFSGTVTGTVSFYDGTTLLKTVGVSKGDAKYTTKTLTAGSHTITATYNGSTSFEGSSSASLTQTVNIVPTLSSIAVAPVNSVLAVGATEQFTAFGTYSDGSVQNITSSVTWTSSKTSVATIAPGGLTTAVAAGTTTIKAASGPVSGNAVLTIN
jgi:uncharacterized repeat protein (TIGR03803 family)